MYRVETSNHSIWPIHRTLSGATTPGQSGHGSNGYKGVLRHSPKLQYYWSLTIRLFCVISRILVGEGVLPLCREAVRVFYSPSLPTECPGYDTKQSDGEASVILELWGMWNTPLLPSLPDPLWLRVVVPDKGPFYGLNRVKLHTYSKLDCFY